MMRIRHLKILGRVQNVGYRAFLADVARQAGVSGWVRNRFDGSVEAVLAGPDDAVDSVIAACRVGPSGGRVDEIVEDDAVAAPRGRDFVVRETI